MSNSTFIGYQANSSVDGITNSTAIGNGAQVTASNQIVLGNSSVVSTIISGNVGIGTTSPQRNLTVTNTGATDQLMLEDTGAASGQHYGTIGFSRGLMSFNTLSDAYATTSSNGHFE